jgi:propionate CoA-transferase
MGVLLYVGIGICLVIGAIIIRIRRRVSAACVGSPLTAWECFTYACNMIRFVATSRQYNLHQAPTENTTDDAIKAAVNKNPKFVTTWEACGHIKEGSVVLSTGFVSHESCFAFYMGLRGRFDKDKKPLNLEWIHVSANGARGKLCGSIEALAVPGMLKRYTAGHLETARAVLIAGGKGTVEVHNVPLGTLSLVVARQASGDDTPLRSVVGLGTNMDPRVGRGSHITAGCTVSYVAATGDGEALEYHLPPIGVCVLNATCADAEGNVYLHRNTAITECIDGARAARRHGGLVLASVQQIIARDDSVPRDMVLAADMVDFICLCTARRLCDPLDMRGSFLPTSTRDMTHSYYQMRFSNAFVGFSPTRYAADLMLGRLAATRFTAALATGGTPKYKGQTLATLGVGLPEEVAFNLFNHGVTPGRVTLCCESGTVGGIPAAGVFFGGAIKPDTIMSEAAMFTILAKHLHVTCLGALEVDVLGNVNVSRKGPGVEGAVGTGGFADMVSSAQNIIFVFSWMSGGTIQVSRDRVAVQQRGKCKLLDRVSEVTFHGATALAQGKRVLYCTHIGVFELRAGGITLTHVFPGVSVERDVVSFAKHKFAVDPHVQIIGTDIVSGTNFSL